MTGPFKITEHMQQIKQNLINKNKISQAISKQNKIQYLITLKYMSIYNLNPKSENFQKDKFHDNFV